MSRRPHCTSVRRGGRDDRFHRHVSRFLSLLLSAGLPLPPSLSPPLFFGLRFVLFGSDGRFNQESRQFINPKGAGCMVLTERTWLYSGSYPASCHPYRTAHHTINANPLHRLPRPHPSLRRQPGAGPEETALLPSE